jgi:hypothetical protein
MPLTSDSASVLLSKVRADSSLPDRIRRQAARLARNIDRPAFVLDRLQRMAVDYLPTLPMDAPREALARVVTPDTFLRHYSNPETRDAFISADDFLNFAFSAANPGTFLKNSLTRNEPLFSWQRSWLTPWSQVRGRSGGEILRDLEMPGSGPVILFEFGRDHLFSTGVTIRTPCSLDSVLGPNFQWREGGPASGLKEYVDGDLWQKTLTSLHWSNR